MAETPPVVAEEPTVPATPGDTVAAAAEPPAQQTDAAQGGPVDSAAQEELVPTDDVKESWNNLPPDVKKIVNKAYTQARQRDKASLKENPGIRLYEALQASPVATYQWLQGELKQRGLLPTGDTPQPAKAPEADAVLAQLAEHVGPEAAQLLRQYADGLVQKEVGPLKQWAGQTVAETTHAQAQAFKASFEAKHPGALAKYETKMSELALRLTDGGRIPTTMKPDEWLDHLYRVVAYDDLVGSEAQKLVTRMQESAQGVDKPGNAVPSSRVAKKAPTLDDFGGNIEAYGKAAGEAALRGEAWE